MASSSTSSALASASTSTADGNNCYQFDVFLNHRGTDVKNTFASHLYNRLSDHRWRIFLDREEIRKGEELTNEIDGAIRAASVHLAIFSPNYCESPWCLNELLLMLEMKQKKGSTILPIFFHVKPSALRWTEGEKGEKEEKGEKGENRVYAEALISLQKKKTFDSLQRYDSNTIGKWKNALKEVAGLSGFELDEAPYNGDEGVLLAAVVKRLLEILPQPPLDVSKYPTGLDDKIKGFEERVLLQQHQNGEARIVGIVGLGGVGKTTLAKEFFNRERTKYPRSSFLCDVRENASRGSLKSLQRQLIKDLSQVDVKINNTHEGISILKQHLSHCHALIIVDDADRIDQLDALLPAKDVLNCNSLILVTSRDKSIFTNWGVEDGFIYMLEGLNPQHSTELFCWHAFQQAHAAAEFEQLVNDFLDACKGFPLSLKVIGSLLYRKDADYWKAQLTKISKTLPEDIQKILKISYDSLDEEEKQIFLDIACLFIGRRKDTAIRVWDGSGWEGSLALQNLQNKCLVEVKVENCSHHIIFPETERMREKAEYIRMHDHLRDLGRDLASKDPTPSRIRFVSLWNQSEGEIKNFPERHLPRLQRPDFKDSSVEGICVGPSLQQIYFYCLDYPYFSLASKISTRNLLALDIRGRNLKTLWHESQAPLNLRELQVVSSMLSKIPKSIGQLKYLEKIVLRGDFVNSQVPLESLPEEFCHLASLKHLALRYCHLRSLPKYFGNLTELQHIDLSNCRKLQTLPSSFRKLTKLQHIRLSRCSELRMPPNFFENFIQLKYLHLTGCEQLTISIETLEKITTLEDMSLSGGFSPSARENIEALPAQLAYLRFLQRLRLDFEFKELPSAIGNLSNLKTLELKSSCLESLPPSLGDLRSLKELTLAYCPLKCVRDSIRMFPQLETLNLEMINDLEMIEIKECPSMEETVEEAGGSVKGVFSCNLLGELEMTESSLLEAARVFETASDSRKLEAVFRNLQCLRIQCDRPVLVLSYSETLTDTFIEKIEVVPSRGTLPSLTTRGMNHCPKLKKVTPWR